MGGSSVLNGCAVFAHKHALALAHASRGGKCKRRGSPPLERSDERSGGGVAQRRSAQTKRGRVGCLLSRARDGVPECTSHLRYKTDQGPALHRTWNPYGS